MNLKTALEIQVQHFGKDGTIRIDERGFICLNDLHSYFPHKRLDHWLENSATKELIDAVSKNLNTRKEGYLGADSPESSNIDESSNSTSALATKRGRHGGGTFAHELVAMDFAAWLSVEFRIHVDQQYIAGTQRKQDWNLRRILAASGYKLMGQAVSAAHDPAKPYHFSNEAKMINGVMTGRFAGFERDAATEEQLEALAWLESHNATLIDLGMDYHERRDRLTGLFETKYRPMSQRIAPEATA